MKLLLVGCGRMGEAHRQVLMLRQFTGLAVEICEPSVQQQDRLRALGHCVYSTLDAALNGAAFDGAVVASPTVTHQAVALRLVDAGVPVLLEKPCGISSSDVRELIRHLETRGKARREAPIVIPGFWRRHARGFVRLRQELLACSIGRPRQVIVAQWDAAPAGLAFQDIRKTGGIELDCGVHEVDTLRWLGLSSPKFVNRATAGPPLDWVPLGDTDGVVLNGLAGDTPVVVSLARTAGGVDEIWYKIIGEAGSVELRLGKSTELAVRTTDGSQRTWRSRGDYFKNALVLQMVDFLEAMRGTPRTGRPTLDDALKAISALS